LARLLAQYIQQQKPAVHVIWISEWSLNGKCDWWLAVFPQKQWGLGRRQQNSFIYDEGQMSYEDSELWNDFFKSLPNFLECCAIVFASYGSATLCFSIKGMPIIILDLQQVNLCHSAQDNGLPPAGLLFIRSEFDDLVIKHYPSLEFCFDPSFFAPLFDITNGHARVIHNFTQIIIANASFCAHKSDDLNQDQVIS
jgi:hypothetical protein